MQTTQEPTPPFSELVEQALVGVYVVQDERLVYANAEMGRLFGYAVADLRAMPSIYALVEEPDRATVQEMLRRRLAGEVESVRYHMCGLRRDGAALEVEVLSRKIEYGGRPAVSGTMIDVTDRRRQERALAEREQRLQTLLDSAPDAVFTCDLAGRFTSVNRSAHELFGFAAGPAIGHSLFETLTPESHDEVRAFLTSTDESNRLTHEVSIVTREGAPSTVALSLQVIARNGAPSEILGIGRDVTPQKRQEAALRTLTLIDELTGLYNRRGFMVLAERHLKLAARKRAGVFLLFCDVDGLKAINDTFGHREGDRALVEAAELLRRTFRSADIIARLGGDEFTVFPLEASDQSGALLVDRLDENVRALNAQHERPYELSMSVGLARFEPDSPWTMDRLLEEADRCLYRNKRERHELRRRSGGV